MRYRVNFTRENGICSIDNRRNLNIDLNYVDKTHITYDVRYGSSYTDFNCLFSHYNYIDYNYPETYVSVIGAEPTRIAPKITQRISISYPNIEKDMDTDGCFEVEGTRYTWKPYNEVYSEIDKAGGVFYQADMEIAKAYGESN